MVKINQKGFVTRCYSNYALPKLIVDNGLEDVHTDIKIGNNTKISDIMVSFTDHYNAIYVDRHKIIIFLSKNKIAKDHGTLIILFYVSPRSPQLHRLFFSWLKIQKNNCSSVSDWW